LNSWYRSGGNFARDGGLLSYGIDLADIPRRAATYVDRILRGEKPGDLPVQFPTKFEMVVDDQCDEKWPMFQVPESSKPILHAE
jgi:ABC-type uncharacterized transport system substrate-binding protein